MVLIVNKSRFSDQQAQINLTNLASNSGDVNGYRLSNLPSSETFQSKSANALQNLFFQITGNCLRLNAPKLSVTLIQVPLMAPLPIKWALITANRAGKNIEVKWVTASEVNTMGFEIERSSNGISLVKSALLWPPDGIKNQSDIFLQMKI